MADISEKKFYVAWYENEGELMEDFPTAYGIVEVSYDVPKGLARFQFCLDRPVYAPDLIERARS
jgi:hypothetical protein